MKAALAPEAAREVVLSEVAPVPSEPVALEECLGRVTAAEVKSAVAIQPFDNSAMDGYALRSADAEGGLPRLRLVGESRAGHPAEAAVGPGEAIWISTGGMVPEGADAVLPIEDAAEEDGHLLPGRPVAVGENVRRAGEDAEAGQTLIGPGQTIGAAEVAVLAAAGVARVECAVRPRVAILGSGDELVPPGEPLGPGQIHDSNTYAVTALVREAGAAPAHVAHLPDDAEATRQAISTALSPELHQLSGLAGRQVDAVGGVVGVLVARGVSVGRHPPVQGALGERG
ncbi:MAG: molybdopterin molybdotransferase MoeA, partial [Solirubrobacterales bacterium]